MPWLLKLLPHERERVASTLAVCEHAAGTWLVQAGQMPDGWLGVMDGLLKVSPALGAPALPIGLAGVGPGGWWGTSACLRRQSCESGVQALRKVAVAHMPLSTFHWLLEHSLGFNRVIAAQLQDGLEHYQAHVLQGRSVSPDERVAKCLAALFQPALYAGHGMLLRITQQELAQLVGLSRQRVNEALAVLEAFGAVQVEYGGLRALDWQALRAGQLGLQRKPEPATAHAVQAQ